MKNTYLIGDTHGTISNILKADRIYGLDNDIVIVAGDFGYIWSDMTLVGNIEMLQEYMVERNTILAFVDGNHENFELLYQFPTETYCGGVIHRIAPNIIHLTRGQVFTFHGQTFFTMGGANSIDKGRRRNRVSWWEEEDITAYDIEQAQINLEAYGYNVDYVISHTCPQEIKKATGFKLEYDSYNENILSDIAEATTFKHWYYGHMHHDITIGLYTCMYYEVVKIPERNENDSN